MHQEWLIVFDGLAVAPRRVISTSTEDVTTCSCVIAIFLADIHDVSIASSTTWGVWVKVEHYLYANVCKIAI